MANPDPPRRGFFGRIINRIANVIFGREPEAPPPPPYREPEPEPLPPPEPEPLPPSEIREEYLGEEEPLRPGGLITPGGAEEPGYPYVEEEDYYPVHISDAYWDYLQEQYIDEINELGGDITRLTVEQVISNAPLTGHSYEWLEDMLENQLIGRQIAYDTGDYSWLEEFYYEYYDDFEPIELFYYH